MTYVIFQNGEWIVREASKGFAFMSSVSDIIQNRCEGAAGVLSGNDTPREDGKTDEVRGEVQNAVNPANGCKDPQLPITKAKLMLELWPSCKSRALFVEWSLRLT